MSLKRLRPGDQVYVVPQASRHVKPEPFWSDVLQIGTKYGYILRYGCKAPFDLLSGESVHNKDCNARFNGLGFDVWLSKEAYDAHIATIEASIRLVTRLRSLQRGSYSDRLDKATPELVADLHEVLDRHGV